MIHEMDVSSELFQRINDGDMTGIITARDKDWQAGDTLHLYEKDRWNDRRKQVYVERDKRGRFVNGYEDAPPIEVHIWHVAPGEHVIGLAVGYVLLSIASSGPVES